MLAVSSQVPALHTPSDESPKFKKVGSLYALPESQPLHDPSMSHDSYDTSKIAPSSPDETSFRSALAQDSSIKNTVAYNSKTFQWAEPGKASDADDVKAAAANDALSRYFNEIQ